MRAEQILTKGEYVYSRKSFWEKFMFNFSWWPFMILFVLLGIAAWNDNLEGQRVFVFLEIPALVFHILVRQKLAVNEARYIDDYYHEYLPSLK